MSKERLWEMAEQDFLSVRQAAELICSTANSVYVMLHKKVFPDDTYFRVGKRKILFSKAKLLAWIIGKEN